MTTVPITCVVGGTAEGKDIETPAGEGLTLAIHCVDSNGIAVNLTGKTVVLGWKGPSTATAVRYEMDGDATGIATFSFTAIETFALENTFARYDVWLESPGDLRDQIVTPSYVNFTEDVAPPEEHTVYYGVGDPGLNVVTSFTAAEFTTGTLQFLVSPTAQKIYFAYPNSLDIESVTHDGFPLGVLASRSITVDDVAYTLLESTYSMTYVGLDFLVTEGT